MGEPVLSGLMPPPGMPRPERSVHPGVWGDSIVRFTLRAEPESDVLPLQLNEEKAVVQGGQGTGEVVSEPRRRLPEWFDRGEARTVRPESDPHDSQIAPHLGRLSLPSGTGAPLRWDRSGLGRLCRGRGGTSWSIAMKRVPSSECSVMFLEVASLPVLHVLDPSVFFERADVAVGLLPGDAEIFGDRRS